MTRWFWLSFADPHLPEGTQFLGVAIVPVTEKTIKFMGWAVDTPEHLKGDAFLTAVRIASFLQINPGGEVQGFEITDDIWRVPADQRGRLLSAEELERTKLGMREAPPHT